MSGGVNRYRLLVVVTVIAAAMLAGCQTRPTDQGQQYKDGHLVHDLEQVDAPNTLMTPANTHDYLSQVQKVKSASMSLYSGNQMTYNAVQNWIQAGAQPKQLAQYGLSAYQMEGKDGFGNVQFTGYYTPLLQARYSRQGQFRYPLYGVPTSKKKGRLPSRAAIYRGALSSKYILAYSNSLMDNFIMEVQGSGYVDFADGAEPIFYSYAGKNGHGYNSIGKVLVARGEIALEDISLQSIRHWAQRKPESEVQALLEQNASYVFFLPKAGAPVKGASGVPLIARAAAAADPELIAPGSTLLAEVPLLDSNGKFTGNYQLRLMVALDVGGAIKGHHFDIYHGIGQQAGDMAGFYNHYGRVWLLKSASGPQPTFTVYQTAGK